ncbi:MAG: hypothetical protein ACHQ5A_09985 [Opitutales bacterium]
MKNIQVIDGARNCVYDIFSATDAEFRMISGPGEDIAFIDEVLEKHRTKKKLLQSALTRIWARRVAKCGVNGIHGLLFYEQPEKKVFYPTRRDEEAMNPNGTAMR